MNAFLDSLAALKWRVSHLMWAIALAAIMCYALVEHRAFEDLVRKPIPTEAGSGSDHSGLSTTEREAEFERLLDSWIASGLPENLSAARDRAEMIPRIEEGEAHGDEGGVEEDERARTPPAGRPSGVAGS
jgi:hypothetical protein